MKIGPFHIGGVSSEKTAAQTLKKQSTIDWLVKGIFGRFFVRFCNPNYALDKLVSLRATNEDHLVEQRRFIEDLQLHPENASNILTLEEQFAVRTYTIEAYVGMNSVLRDTDSKFANDPYFTNLNTKATAALAKISQAQAQFGLTFRGLNGAMPHAKLKEGDTYTEKAFTSTSKNAQVSKGFAGMDRDKNPGTMLYAFGKSGANIKEFSGLKGEDEVLYPPSTQFKVIFSENEHESTKLGFKGCPEVNKTNHKVLEEVGTPANQGHSGVLDALDLARPNRKARK